MVAVAGMTPAQTDKFYEERGLLWEKYLGQCETKKDALVKAIDDLNAANAKLEKARK